MARAKGLANEVKLHNFEVIDDEICRRILTVLLSKDKASFDELERALVKSEELQTQPDGTAGNTLTTGQEVRGGDVEAGIAADAVAAEVVAAEVAVSVMGPLAAAGAIYVSKPILSSSAIEAVSSTTAAVTAALLAAASITTTAALLAATVTK